MKKQYIAPVIEQLGIAPEIDIALKISFADGKFSGGDILNDTFFDDDFGGPSANSGDWDDESSSWFDY